ncbi:MAG: Flp family type IVb pilin [Candidatus Dormibacteria bacterium]
MRLGCQEEKGQGIVEYAFIIVLIALAVLVTVILLGHQVNNVYSNIEKGVKYATG